MTQFSNKFKKSCFWPIFPHFWGKKNFLENLALSRTTSYGFLAPCQNLEKVNDTIQRKCPDRQTEGWTELWKDGRTDRPYFIRPFQLLPGVQLKTLLLVFGSLINQFNMTQSQDGLKANFQMLELIHLFSKLIVVFWHPLAKRRTLVFH